MSRADYWVDWSDPSYPEVRHAKFAHPHEENFKTFAEAKAEIIEHFTEHARSARASLAQYRKLRQSDVAS